VARLTVGLTGGIASGKSTVARRFVAAGFTVVDADHLVAELHRADQPGAKAVGELLGADFLDAEGATDKSKVAARVFADAVARERLEAALFPLVRERFRELAQATGGVAVLEATKLVEADFAPDFDVVVTVEAPVEARIARAVARGLSPGEARARLAAQADEATRRAAAHERIENAGTLEELERAADALATRLRRRASLED
jgi:dephospho-CoA kinase